MTEKLAPKRLSVWSEHQRNTTMPSKTLAGTTIPSMTMRNTTVAGTTIPSTTVAPPPRYYGGGGEGKSCHASL